MRVVGMRFKKKFPPMSIDAGEGGGRCAKGASENVHSLVTFLLMDSE